MVDDVVAVGGAGARLHDRRCIEVADAKLGEVRDQRLRVAKGEAAVKL
jgi:hypothetical protein